jgi:hypothetical protein
VMLDRSALTGNNRNQLVAVVNWKEPGPRRELSAIL